MLPYTAISGPIAGSVRPPDRAGNRPPPGNQAARLAAPAFRLQHQCLGATTAPPVSQAVPSISLNYDVPTTGYPTGGAMPFILLPSVSRPSAHLRRLAGIKIRLRFFLPRVSSNASKIILNDLPIRLRADFKSVTSINGINNS